MKEALINLINNQNKKVIGGFIEQSVPEYVDKILKSAYIQTYMVEGEIAGFVAYYCNDPKQQHAFLTMLCIAPEYIGKGIGRHLLHCSITDIKNRGFITYELEVKENNLPAIHLYKVAGFEIVGILDGTIKMKKDIHHES